MQALASIAKLLLMDKFGESFEKIRDDQLAPMWKELQKATTKLVQLRAKERNCELQTNQALATADQCRAGWRSGSEFNITVCCSDEQSILVIRWNSWKPHREVLPAEIRINKAPCRSCILFQRLSFVPLTLPLQTPRYQVELYSLGTRLSRGLVLTPCRLLQPLHLPGMERFEEVQACLSEVLKGVGSGFHCEGAESVRRLMTDTSVPGEAIWQYLVEKKVAE